MKNGNRVFFVLIIISYALSGCSPKRFDVPSYSQTDQDSEIKEEGKGKWATITTRFTTQDSPDTVKQFYEKGLADAGWSVELLPLAVIQPLPALPTDESILVHGNDIRDCPLYYVDVIIEPLDSIGANVTTISGAVPCY